MLRGRRSIHYPPHLENNLMSQQLDSIDTIATKAFEGYVVRKDLVRKFKGQYPVPTYVAEFLLGRYCASVDDEEISDGLKIVERQLGEKTIRAGEHELFKARAKDKGQVKLIDIITARLDADTDSFLATLPSLQLKDVRISQEMVNANERMLTGGFYAEVELAYDPTIAQEKNGRPFGIESLREIQLSKRYFPDGSRVLDAHATNQEHMQHSMSRAFNGGRKHLLRWVGPAQFREQTGVLSDEVSRGWTLAIGAADLDGDLLPEIYFANDFGPDRLLYNRSTPGHFRFELLHGERTLTVPRSKVLGNDSFKGMGVDFADLNGDGYPDIFVSNIAMKYALLESHFVFESTGHPELMKQGIAPYVDRSEPLGLSRSGWAWDAKLADFNNDGIFEALQAVGFVKGQVDRWPELQELAMGNDELLPDPRSWPRFQPGDDLCGNLHNPFFVKSASGRYYDVAVEMGLGESHVSRGIAIADVDGDGRLDYAVANQWEPSLFFHNSSPQPGQFLGLRLRLAPDRPAIGAAATVFLPDGRKMTAQVDGGNGHSGKRSQDIHFGLGSVPAQIGRAHV